jgi:hypothetical protein
MKRRGANGLGGGFERMRGVKNNQFMCRKTGSKRIRREEPGKY